MENGYDLKGNDPIERTHFLTSMLMGGSVNGTHFWGGSNNLKNLPTYPP